MAEKDFFDPGAKSRAADAIKKVEQRTSAEIVISVRRRSGNYRAADLWFGSACAMASLAFMIYSPRTFAPRTMPLDVAIGFALGILVAANVGTLERLLTGARTLKGNVEGAAKQSFYDLGIANTHRRSGILVFASLFEQSALLVADRGIDTAALASELRAAERALGIALRSRDFAAFLARVEELGETLGKVMPRHEGDQNELPDEMQ